MPGLFIFGLGFSAGHLRRRLEAQGWRVAGTRRAAAAGALAFADEAAVRVALAGADAVLSSVPPDETGADPVLARYGDALDGRWIGYFSSTGVYGDSGGAWVDESAAIGRGRRQARAAADAAWLARGARVFRLPGIYGPGRSALERVEQGRAHRVDLPGQLFSRIHVEDIARGVIAALDAPAGAYNLADDEPASQNAVVEQACRLLGRAPPPLLPPDDPALSPLTRGFFAETRRIATGKARRLLGWRPVYPDYRAGLAACLAARPGAAPLNRAAGSSPTGPDPRPDSDN
ncbi:SDR family NAD(P)-dependent oxidoreductase [Sphingomonas morindae]|uniref:SDR family NAD(P)-dependent oxidoreductase n=1 Tax=Sphingomonas morindae TaxID=1541170 RepID=A0ABY4XAX4_9SPHN|nr:SDR family NAD(P)-dependent oxidoreductase [Sphingomonas morindae]USI74094.1 SDR family NAD(P)-dependent oxidoreductase [Sphingomonas morindae]